MVYQELAPAAVGSTSHISLQPPLSEVTDFEQLPPFGIAICGEAQAGKTTLRQAMHPVWKSFHPDEEIYVLNNSLGFRGLAYRIVEKEELPLGHKVSLPVFEACLEDFREEADVLSEVEKLYDEPPVEGVMRSLAVDSIVAMVADDPELRPVISEAATQHLIDVVENPTDHGLTQQPGLILIDARSHLECIDKFERARIKPLATFILTCDPEIAAPRNARTGQAPDPEMLRQRNERDRNRLEGRMSLPEDFVTRFVLDNMLEHGFDLELAGRNAAKDPVSTAIVIRTDRTSLAEEVEALTPLFKGMLSAKPA